MAITLTQDQLNKINNDFINKAKPDYAGMYLYIFKEVGSQMPADQRYWFEQQLAQGALACSAPHEYIN